MKLTDSIPIDSNEIDMAFKRPEQDEHVDDFNNNEVTRPDLPIPASQPKKQVT